MQILVSEWILLIVYFFFSFKICLKFQFKMISIKSNTCISLTLVSLFFVSLFRCFTIQLYIFSVSGKYLPSGNGVASHDDAADCITCLKGSYANKRCPLLYRRNQRGVGNIDRGGNPYMGCDPTLPNWQTTDSAYYGASACIKCGAGFYQPNNESASCFACGTGKYLPNGASLAAHISIAQCLPCNKGYYQNYVGSYNCRHCPKGYYQDQTGITGCKRCNPGFYTNQNVQPICKDWYVKLYFF